MRIHYSIVASPLDDLLVAASSKGICTVCLGKSESALEAALRKEYPAAELRRDEETLSEWVQALLKHLDGQQPHLELPLDLQATAFQWRVWKAVRNIPYGQTRTYTEIARAIHHPGAARAVARACATNPVALVIPCHRIVRGDGSLGGYRWGLERKRKLLSREKSAAASAKKKWISELKSGDSNDTLLFMREHPDAPN